MTARTKPRKTRTTKTGTTIYFSDEERLGLSQEKERQTRSINELVREAVRQYLEVQAIKRLPKEATY